MRFARIVVSCAAIVVLGTPVLTLTGSSAAVPQHAAAAARAGKTHHAKPKRTTAD